MGNHEVQSAERVSFAVFGGLMATTLLSGAILSNIKVSADTTKTTDVSVSVSSVCNLTSNVSEAHTAEITPGLDFEDNIGTTDMTATCNDGNGYAIYAVGFTGDAIGQTNSTKLVGTGGTIDTRDYDASYKDTSYWSMQLTAGTGADAATIENSYNSYKAIPATYTKVASKASATSATPTTAFSTTYGAYAVTSQTAGDYSGKVKYILVHPGSNQPGTYTIAFSANGGTGTMASQTGLTNYEDQTINTMSGITAPSGYQFAGWCNNQQSGASATNPQTTCSGTTYNDNGTVPANTVNANSTLTLYAIWQEVPSMQSMTSAKLAELMPNTGDATIIPDVRDDQNYTIAKLADGKYWMVENLNLAGGAALSAADTDVTSDYISSFSTSNNLTKTDNTIVLPASSTSGFDTENYSYVYNTGNKTSTCTSPGCYSYYSWDAATLGSSRGIATDNQNAEQSICPKNWKLPTTYNGTDSDTNPTDFRGLMMALGGFNTVQTYNSSTNPTGATMYGKISASPYNFLLAGLYYNGSFYSGGSYGYYWSATSYSNSSSARNLRFDSSNVYSASNYGGRTYGFSVRCLFSGS